MGVKCDKPNWPQFLALFPNLLSNSDLEDFVHELNTFVHSLEPWLTQIRMTVSLEFKRKKIATIKWGQLDASL